MRINFQKLSSAVSVEDLGEKYKVAISFDDTKMPADPRDAELGFRQVIKEFNSPKDLRVLKQYHDTRIKKLISTSHIITFRLLRKQFIRTQPKPTPSTTIPHNRGASSQDHQIMHIEIEIFGKAKWKIITRCLNKL